MQLHNVEALYETLARLFAEKENVKIKVEVKQK